MRTQLRRSAITIAVIAATCLTPAGVANAAPATPDRPIVHQVPRVPVTIDGKAVSPDAVTLHDGRPLYSAALPEGGPYGSLAIFTDPIEFETFVSAHGGPPHALARPQPATPDKAIVSGPATPAPRPTDVGTDVYGYTYIYEHADFWGYWLGIYSGQGAQNLTRWDMSCTLWFCDDWNDETSSLWADNAFGQTVYEHTNWTGSALWTPGGSWRAYLDPLGWNDRVSSFWSHG